MADGLLQLAFRRWKSDGPQIQDVPHPSRAGWPYSDVYNAHKAALWLNENGYLARLNKGHWIVEKDGVELLRTIQEHSLVSFALVRQEAALSKARGEVTR